MLTSNQVKELIATYQYVPSFDLDLSKETIELVLNGGTKRMNGGKYSMSLTYDSKTFNFICLREFDEEDKQYIIGLLKNLGYTIVSEGKFKIEFIV